MEDEMTNFKYTVRRPLSGEIYLRGEGAIVSRHVTLDGARRSLERQRRGAARQGGYSQDYIWDQDNGIEITH